MRCIPIALTAELERKWGVLNAGVQYDAYRNDIAAAPRGQPLPGDRLQRARRAARPQRRRPPPARAWPRSASRRTTTRSPPTRARRCGCPCARASPPTPPSRAGGSRTRPCPRSPPTPRSTPRSPPPILRRSRSAPSTEPSTSTPRPCRSPPRPGRASSLRARVRRYAMDNRTPRVALPGVARLDAVWEAVPRITVPYSHDRTRVEGSIGYGLGSWRAEAGPPPGRHRADVPRDRGDERDRLDGRALGAAARGRATCAFTTSTATAASRPTTRASRRARRGSTCIRCAASARDGATTRRRATSIARGRASSWRRSRPSCSPPRTRWSCGRYPLTAYGLVRTRAHVASADASFAPGGRWSAHAFYALELESSFQRVRHSPQPTHLHRPARHLGRDAVRHRPLPGRGLRGRPRPRPHHAAAGRRRSSGRTGSRISRARPAAPPTSRRTSPPSTTCAG